MASSTKRSTTSSFTDAAFAHPKIEKKIMEGKISKVREVVKNISTNDIVLALHNFELDVEKTIHAFCEGGSEIALGHWEKTSTTKKRSNKRKPKPIATSAAALPLTGTGDNCNANGSILCKGNFGTMSISSTISSDTTSNGLTNDTNQTIAPNLRIDNSSSAYANPMVSNKQLNYFLEQPSYILMNGSSDGQPSIGLNPFDVTAHRPQIMAPIGSKDVFVKAPPAFINDTSDYIINGKASVETFGSNDNRQTYLDQNKQLFENEIIHAQKNINHCFKVLRETVNSREQQLQKELSECKRNGLDYFSLRIDAIQRMSMSSNGEKTDEKFNGSTTEDLETALTARFLSDDAALTLMANQIEQLGTVIPVKSPIMGPQKEIITTGSIVDHSNQQRAIIQQSAKQKIRPRSKSPSSLASSVDFEPSDQISPSNQGRTVAQVAVEGGIMLKSDSISVDQLAEIQRNIIESLKAKGIDPSMLADINSNMVVTAPRRRPPPASTMAKNGGGIDGNKHRLPPNRANNIGKSKTGNEGEGIVSGKGKSKGKPNKTTSK